MSNFAESSALILIFGIFITTGYSIAVRIFIDSNRHKRKHLECKKEDPVLSKKSKKHEFRIIHNLIGLDFGILSFSLTFPFLFGKEPKVDYLVANEIATIFLKTTPKISPYDLTGGNLIIFLVILPPAIWYFSTKHFELALKRCGKVRFAVSWLSWLALTLLLITVLLATIVFITGTKIQRVG